MKKAYTIEYSCGCTLGNVRRNNEDNFYCAGFFRTDPYDNNDVFLNGKVKSFDNELFAVFDGMGGEACSEIASFVAAQTCKYFCEDKHDMGEYLYELCELLNERVVEETKARSLVLMGSTAAMIQFNKDEIYILNAGDSKILKFSSDSVHQISKDHVASGYGIKAPLTQFLGIPVEEGVSPYIARGRYGEGDIFLLCTDGVTDMLSNEQLCEILKSDFTLEQKVRKIIDDVKLSGAKDNATVVLCQISK